MDIDSLLHETGQLVEVEESESREVKVSDKFTVCLVRCMLFGCLACVSFANLQLTCWNLNPLSVSLVQSATGLVHSAEKFAKAFLICHGNLPFHCVRGSVCHFVMSCKTLACHGMNCLTRIKLLH